jgi:hypothetical protein
MTLGIQFVTRKLLAGALAVALASAGAISIASCSQRDGNEKQVAPVSRTPPKLEPMRTAARPLVARPRVASEGDCAPRYAKGGRGTCINNQPCRGFGVRAESGAAVCICFAREGGCGEGQRCDLKKMACVPETEPPFGRGRAN